MAVYDENVIDLDLRKSKSAFERTVKGHVSAWIKLYECKRDALRSLVTLIFKACKCPIKVSEEIPDDMEWDLYLGNIENMLEDHDGSEVSIVYIKDDMEFSYAKNLSDFIVCIMMESQHDILIDDYFSLNLLKLLKVLSKSHYHSFRHGSTLIALKMVTAMSNIMRTLVKQLSDCNRQLSVEMSKSAHRRSTERVENLETIFSVAGMESSKIEELLNEFYGEIIKDRFRDTGSDISLMCLAELQVWFSLHGKYYLKPKYLMHLRHCLCDSKVLVLSSTLKVVKFIYQKCDFREIDAFANAIQNSIVTLSINDSETVSCLAIEVASAMIERNSLCIEEDEKEFLQYLVFAPELKVSCEAAAFFHQLLMIDLKNQIGKNRNVPTLYLLQLKDFIIKNNASEKIDLLVESMLSVPDSYLLTWKSYVVLLLKDEFKAKTPYLLKGLPDDVISSLNDEDEKIIMSLMLGCMRQVLTPESPRCRNKNKIQKSKAFEERKGECVKAMESLFKCIPRLMEKFMSENSVINNLMSICSMMGSSCCTCSEDIQILGEMFQKLMEIQVDVQVHIKGAKALSHWCKGNYMFKLLVLSPFLDDIAIKWRTSLKSYCEICEKKQQSSSSEWEKEGEEMNVIFALTKYCALLWTFSNHFSLDEHIDLNQFFELSLGHLKKDYAVPGQVMEYSYKTLHAIILREAADQPSELFKTMVEEFIALSGIILQGEYKCSYKHLVFMCLTENICMLRSLMANFPSWMTDCFTNVAVQIVKYFSSIVCQKDGLDNLSRKEEEEAIVTFLTLIQKKVLPRQAVVYILIYCNKKPMKHFTVKVKDTMSVVQSWGMKDFALSLHEALSLSFENLQYCDDDGRKNEMFQELQELANVFMEDYASTLAKNRDAAFEFHLNGIDFATSMRDDFENPVFAAPFIVILSIFIPVIHQSDIRSLAAHLLQRIEDIEETTTPDPNDMELFSNYMKYLSPEPRY